MQGETRWGRWELNLPSNQVTIQKLDKVYVQSQVITIHMIHPVSEWLHNCISYEHTNPQKVCGAHAVNAKAEYKSRIGEALPSLTTCPCLLPYTLVVYCELFKWKCEPPTAMQPCLCQWDLFGRLLNYRHSKVGVPQRQLPKLLILKEE